ncbi:MAG: hypothetical protein KY453_01665 [Gemmatimonadetes bacterium]|nr:hypothetical protein [Gemmatimonadota bacterium]
MAAALAGLVAVLAFANSLANRFAYDDVHVIVENTALKSLETLPGLIFQPYWPGTFGSALGLWRPGMTAILGLQWAAWDGNPAMFHLVNVLAHAAATVLVVVLVARLSTVPVAFLAGIIFAVHPVHVEAVANVVGLADVLSAALVLAACILHLGAPAHRYGAIRLAGVAALFLAAFSVKESAVTLPAILFLLDAARGRMAPRDLPGYLRGRWHLYATLAAIAVAMLVLRHSVLGSIASALGPLGADRLEGGIPRIWTLAQIWAHYVRLLVLPLDLSPDYAPNVIPIALGWTLLAAVGALLMLGILVLALWAWRSPPLEEGRTTPRILAFGVVWFGIVISPVSNVFFLAGVLLAERTLYLPSVGAAFVGGWLLVSLYRRRRRVALLATTLVVLFMTVRTVQRNPTWRDNDILFGTMIAQYPQSGRSQWVLGDLFLQAGRLSESLRTYRIAVGILGGHYKLLAEMGQNLMNAGHHEAATRLLLKAWRDEPELAAAPVFLAISHHQRGMWPEAERFGRAAFAADPESEVMAHLLAGSLAQQGEIAEAAVWRQRTIALGEAEHWQQWISLAGLHLALEDSVRARAALDSALARRGEVSRSDILEAYRPFTPAREVLQDSTQLQDARGPDASRDVQESGR